LKDDHYHGHGKCYYEYEKSELPDTYLMHAEYATNDDFRTVIHGKIWRALETPDDKNNNKAT